MIISNDIFASIGGFDEKLRYLKVQDLAHKLHAKHLILRFDPTIALKHLAVDVREKVRSFWSAH